MTEILTDLSPVSLTSANKANLKNIFRYFRHAPMMVMKAGKGSPAEYVRIPYSDSKVCCPLVKRTEWVAGLVSCRHPLQVSMSIRDSALRKAVLWTFSAMNFPAFLRQFKAGRIYQKLIYIYEGVYSQ